MTALERTDPLAGFRFGVKIEGIEAGWFTEVSGLTVNRDVLPHEEGGLNAYVHQLPKRITYEKVTLKRGIADMTLWSWFQEGLYDLKVVRRPVTITFYGGDRQKMKQWSLTDAYPVKWTGPDLKTEGNQVAIETLELVHHGLTTTDWTATTASS